MSISRTVTIELLDAIQDGFNRHDVDDILSYFADDCEWLMARGPEPWEARRLRGKQAIGEGWNRDALEPWAKFLVGHFRRNSAKAPIVFRRLRKFVANYSQLYAGHDVLLAPTLGGPTHRIGHLAPDVPGEVQMERARQQVPTTWVHNIGGGPSISLPMATDRRGLPMGMDFSADLGEEALLLGLALELEAAHPWPSLA